MKKNLATMACIAAFILTACQSATPTLPPATPQPTATLIPTSTPLPTSTPMPTPIVWQSNPDKTLNPPPDEREAIEKAYKKALTAFMVLEDAGKDPMKYPVANEKTNILAKSPVWNLEGLQKAWFVGEYKSFDVRCFDEQTCEAAYTVHITGMILGSDNCNAARVEKAENGNCWYAPDANKNIWQNFLKGSRDWYDRTLMVKINNQWYAGGYASYPLNSTTPTPWSP